MDLREAVSIKPIPSIQDYRSLQSYHQVSYLVHAIIVRELRFFQHDQRKLLQSLLRREDFTLEATFNSLCSFTSISEYSDSSNQAPEYISERSMSRFFRRNGFFASKEEVSAIVRRLDLNYDEVVTKDELSKYIVNASKICSDRLAKSHYNNTTGLTQCG